MAQLISLSDERQRRRPQPVLCSKCSRRMSLSESLVAADGRRWKIYTCERCKNFEWRAALPQTDLI